MLTAKRAVTKVQTIVLITIIIVSFITVCYVWEQMVKPPLPPPEGPSSPPPPHQSRQLIDSDGDGIDNVVEGRYGLDPRNPDTDGDGIPDGVELDWRMAKRSESYQPD